MRGKSVCELFHLWAVLSRPPSSSKANGFVRGVCLKALGVLHRVGCIIMGKGDISFPFDGETRNGELWAFFHILTLACTVIATHRFCRGSRMHARMHRHTHTLKHPHRHAHTHTHTHIQTHTHTHTQTPTQTRTHTQTHTSNSLSVKKVRQHFYFALFVKAKCKCHFTNIRRCM